MTVRYLTSLLRARSCPVSEPWRISLFLHVGDFAGSADAYNAEDAVRDHATLMVG